MWWWFSYVFVLFRLEIHYHSLPVLRHNGKSVTPDIGAYGHVVVVDCLSYKRAIQMPKESLILWRHGLTHNSLQFAIEIFCAHHGLSPFGIYDGNPFA